MKKIKSFLETVAAAVAIVGFIMSNFSAKQVGITFHDNVITVKWLIDNSQFINQSFIAGIVLLGMLSAGMFVNGDFMKNDFQFVCLLSTVIVVGLELFVMAIREFTKPTPFWLAVVAISIFIFGACVVQFGIIAMTRFLKAGR